MHRGDRRARPLTLAWRRRLLASIFVATLFSLAPVAPPDAAAQGRSTPRPTVSERTALLIVQLGDDGSIQVGGSSVKPIAWRTRSAPWRPSLSDAPPLTGPTPRAREVAVVVQRPAHAPPGRPHVVVITLDAPAHGGGDVVDPWDVGSAIWRLPHFGPGTRYRFVRLDPAPLATLGSWIDR